MAYARWMPLLRVSNLRQRTLLGIFATIFHARRNNRLQEVMIEWPTQPSNDSDGMLCYGFDDLLMYTI